MNGMTERLPDEIEYGFVADRVLKAVGDTPNDGDRYPDGVAAQGTVRFTPMARHLFTQNEPATISVANIECKINPGHDDPEQTGLLVDPAGHTGNVALVVGWYQVTYLLEGESPDRFTIQVKPEHTNEEPLWLPRARELKPQPSERFVVNEQVYKDTIAARDETMDYRDEAGQFRDQAAISESNAATSATSADTSATTAADILAATQALGITVDTSVGTRVYVGDTMIHGDTGWRDVSYLFSNAESSSPLRLRRSNSMVTLDLYGVQPTADLNSGSTFIGALPSGFRPNVRRNFGLQTDLSSSTFRSAFQFATGSIGCWAPSTDDIYYYTLTYPTSDPWPTSLPGTPL